MRICPTNVLQPAGFEGGIEGLWTPVLNNRIGSSGCQLNCVACGQICPTSAIRPITLSEKLGKDEFAEAGPIKLGTAFIDQGRCLPWAMDRPCIVCQENCPLSPKAIYTREYFSTIRDGVLTVKKMRDNTIEILETIPADKFTSGDYYISAGIERKKIATNTGNSVITERFEKNPAAGDKIELQIRLQRPYIDVEKCIGCGVCEHECPVSGRKAVRVSAEGESRSIERRLLLER
jgi:ferredoxin